MSEVTLIIEYVLSVSLILLLLQLFPIRIR